MPTIASAKLLDKFTAQLSTAERHALQNRQAIVTCRRGRCVGWVLIAAPLDTVWQVLTDYANFDQFLPNVTASRVLSAKGDRTIVEQTDTRRVLLADVTSTIQTENIERAPERIDFRLLNGDLKRLEGCWRIYPASDDERMGSPQVLLTQTASAEANAGLFEGIFHQVFESSLSENLTAIQAEAERRSI